MAKINIAQLAAFRSGEVLTEQKLNEVFTLIGTVLNFQDDLYLQLIRDLQSLKVARRYLGTVENYSSIIEFINVNKDNPIYQPPNDPLPSSGDILFVTDNSDDPNLSPTLKPGAYMYIYTNVNEWSLYSPFSLVKADATQDGLMSKESFQDLQNVKSNTSDLTNKYNELKQQVDNIDLDLTNNLKNDINQLKENKQDIKTKKGDTYLKGYTTETVEGNLMEVKEQVDFITSSSIEIWEKQDSDVITYETIDNTYYKIYVDLNKDNAFVPRSYIKCYFSFPGKNGLDQSFQTTMLVLDDAKNTGYGFASYHDETLNDWINLQIRYVYDLAAQEESKQKYFEIVLYDKESTTSPIAIDSLKPIKVIKDLGVSDYLWAEILEKDIKEFLKNYMGIKKYVCYSNVNSNNYNGFRAGDILTLDYYYIYGAKSLTVTVGGITLIQGMEWEEYADTVQETSFVNQIKFLRDVNIDQEGFIEVKGVALVINSMQFKIWNSKDLYQIGEVVIENNSLWYSKQPNINKRPSQNNPDIWNSLTYSIDLDSLKQEIQEYINQVSGDIVNNVIDGVVDDRLEKLPTVQYISDGPGVKLVFSGGEAAFEQYKQVMNVDNSYFRIIGSRPVIDRENIVYKNRPNSFIQLNEFSAETKFKASTYFIGSSDRIDYWYQSDFGKLIAFSDEANAITASNQLITKKYVDEQVKDLTTSINQLKEYAKTGIVQMVIWNQNGYRIRLIPILTPPSLIGRENEFFNRIHISTTTYKQNNSSEPTIFNEYEGGEYVEIKNPRMNTDIIVNSLNTNNFRDNNMSMNLYSWWDMNQNLISPVGNWAPKLIVPITSRYDRNGQVVYLVYKSMI